MLLLASCGGFFRQCRLGPHQLVAELSHKRGNASALYIINILISLTVINNSCLLFSILSRSAQAAAGIQAFCLIVGMNFRQCFWPLWGRGTWRSQWVALFLTLPYFLRSGEEKICATWTFTVQPLHLTQNCPKSIILWLYKGSWACYASFETRFAWSKVLR